jgi:hypothetical protein
MDKNIVFGTAGTEKMRISTDGIRIIGSTSITGSTVISGSLKVVAPFGTELDTGNYKLNIQGATSVDWASKQLVDTNSVATVDWENLTLTSPSGPITKVDWGAGELTDNSNNLSVDWNNRTLLIGAASSVDWSARRLYNSSGTIILDWESATFAGTADYATTAGSAGSATSATTAGSVGQPITFNGAGVGAAAGTSYDGSIARTISYNTIGAAASGGGNASGTWGISISGLAATATSASFATTATSATSATNASNVAITNDTTTNATYFPTFVSSTSGNNALRVDSSTLTWNPSTNTLTAANFAGNALTATNATSATSASFAQASISSSTIIVASGPAGNYSVPWMSTTTSGQPAFLGGDSTLMYNRTTQTLATAIFSGALTGNATSATTIQTVTNSTSANYYLTFVADDNAFVGSYETLNTDAGILYNPGSNALTVSGATSIGGNLTMTGGVITNRYVAHGSGTTAMAFGSYGVVRVVPNATATYTTTVPAAGTRGTLIVVTSGTTSYTITFGTGFKTTATLVTGTVSARTFTISFVSDGTNVIETSRTIAMA